MIRMTPSAAVHSTNWPFPRNLSRAKRADITPIAAKVPPTWSASHHPERVGVPPNATGAPVPWVKPIAFCPTGSLAPGWALGGAPLAALPHPEVHETRVDLGKLAVADPQLVEVPRGRIFDQDVDLRDYFFEQILPLFRLHVEGDGKLVPRSEEHT